MGNPHQPSIPPDPAIIIQNLESFQSYISELLEDLSSAESDELMSIPWLHKLLNALSMSLDRFIEIIRENQLKLSESPIKKIVSSYLEMSVISLDLLNAVYDRIDAIVRWNDYSLCTAVYALNRCHYDRANRAIKDFPQIIEVKSTGEVSFNSMLPKDWSAYKKLQVISDNNKSPPKGIRGEIGGISVTIFSIRFMEFLTLWILVAAIPCHGKKNLNIRSKVSIQGFKWCDSIVSLRKRVMKLDSDCNRRNGMVLIKEMRDIENCWQLVISLIDSAPSEERKRAIGEAAIDLGKGSESLKVGLNFLRELVREVFRKMMSFRNEVDSMMK